MRFVSWNVNGLRAVVKKGFETSFADLDADVFCLQETKMQEGQLDLAFKDYTSVFNYAERKGYSGTAVYSRVPVFNVSKGLGIDAHDMEGRVITVDLGELYLVNVYTPNSQDGLARLAYRQEWDRAFAEYVKRLDQSKPVVICGDMNVAHKEIDLSNPKGNRRNPGFTDEERDGFTSLLADGFVDSFRLLYPELEKAYTWWSYRFNSRAKNVGWRIDYFLVSARLAEHITTAAIHSEIMGSDHCPVSLELDI